MYKIHATDILNKPFLELIISKKDCRVFLETQCATKQDIDSCLSIIRSSVDVIFHGFSDYPTKYEDLELNALDDLKQTYPEFETGFADHSLDYVEIPLMALSKGVSYLEKHITLSRKDKHFDYEVSLEPDEFKKMVQAIKKYSPALGKGVKHPVANESKYRSVMYKKKIEKEPVLKRADQGLDYLSWKVNNFSTSKIGIAIIARLKSKRLPLKVLLKLGDETLINGLYNSLKHSNEISGLFLATSDLYEDKELTRIADEKGQKYFTGNPVSVLDRMLSLAIREEWGGIFRVTGDNPFTSVLLVDRMAAMFKTNELDYIRCNNVPFGVSAELFSTAYLWRLYLGMENPNNSEYLSWFVLNDINAKKACINFVPQNNKLRYVNLSVDYPEDLQRVQAILKRSGRTSLADIDLSELVKNADYNDIIDENKEIKLPEGSTIKLVDYLGLIENTNYIIKEQLKEDDLYNS